MNMMDLYTTRSMTEALKLIPKAFRFLQETFFPVVQMHETHQIDIDVFKGGQRLACFVHPNHEGIAKQKKGYSTHSYKVPYVKELITLTAHEMLQRDPGRHVYDNNLSVVDRAVMRLAEEMQESSDAIDRRIEWMCAQLLQTGMVRCKGEGIDETIDFLLPASHTVTLSGAALWSATTTATPFTNLSDWCRTLSNMGYPPTTAVMSPDVLPFFLKNTAEIAGVNGILNQSGMFVGKADVVDKGNGVVSVGTLSALGLQLYTYSARYADDQADYKEQLMIPSGRIVLGGGAARGMILHYGSIADLQSVNVVPKFIKSWTTENPSKVLGLIQSAPLPAPHAIESILSAKVL